MTEQKNDIFGIKEEPKHGKKPNQKLKPYLVMQILMRQTDENNVMTADGICAELHAMGVYAERRSIYRDIDEINKVLLMIDKGCTVEEAEDMLFETDTSKTIVYDKSRKGFYVRQRNYDLNDIRVLVECINAAKFISVGQAKRLTKVICKFVSDHQAKQIANDTYLVGRAKTTNNSVFDNIAAINRAMSRKVDGRSHEPEKISFKYLKYDIDHLSTQSYRRRGQKYVVSPYKLIINDGNYYLLGFDERCQEMRTYRLDRMQNVSLLNEQRDGADEFASMDLENFTQRVFGMFTGEQHRVTLRFDMELLDAAVDRFGTKGVVYQKVDDAHFEVTVTVDVSAQFFAWLCGFGASVKIVAPEFVVEKYKKHLDKVREMY